MDNIFNSILTNTSSQITVSSAVLTMLLALALGGAIGATYRKTQRCELYQRNLAVTLFMLPAILSVIILFIGSNIARAFSLAGTLSIIRFRSAPGDAKDIGYIFFDIAAGLACGVGLYAYAVLFVAVLCAAIIFAEKLDLFAPKAELKTLRITIPEDLNSDGAFDEIFERYTDRHSLAKIKTTDLGSLFQLVYTVAMKDGASERDFINELRVRNGNLTVMLSEMPEAAK